MCVTLDVTAASTTSAAAVMAPSLKDVTWASKLRRHARGSGHQRHIPARAKSVHESDISVQSQYRVR